VNRVDSLFSHERFALFERDSVFLHFGSPRRIAMVTRRAEKKKFQK
jgi:hypothetical protein